MVGEHHIKNRDFKRFYLEKVAIGEGCGCAEQAIGMLDIEASLQKNATHKRTRTTIKTSWSRFLALIRPQRSKEKCGADSDQS